MNKKRTLHVMLCPLTRRNVLAALMGDAAKASVLFYAPQEARTVDIVLAWHLNGNSVEEALLRRIVKHQPLDWLGADGRVQQQLLPTWALY